MENIHSDLSAIKEYVSKLKEYERGARLFEEFDVEAGREGGITTNALKDASALIDEFAKLKLYKQKDSEELTLQCVPQKSSLKRAVFGPKAPKGKTETTQAMPPLKEVEDPYLLTRFNRIVNVLGKTCEPYSSSSKLIEIQKKMDKKHPLDASDVQFLQNTLENLKTVSVTMMLFHHKWEDRILGLPVSRDLENHVKRQEVVYQESQAKLSNLMKQCHAALTWQSKRLSVVEEEPENLP